MDFGGADSGGADGGTGKGSGAGAVKVKYSGGIKWLRHGDGVAVLTAARARALALMTA